VTAWARFEPDYRKCLAASAALHAFLLFFRALLPSASAPTDRYIDLTMPFVGSGPPKLAAPKRLIPEAKLPPAPVPEPLPPEPVKPKEQPKDWALPGPETKKTVAPEPEAPPPTQGGAKDGDGISPLTGGKGQGFAYGVPNGTMTPGAPADVVRPKLLNKDEVLKNLRKFYPERERVAGHEAKVIVDLYIEPDGTISKAEVLQSGGILFDRAALEVTKIMRFAPARDGGGAAVGAKVRIPMQFSLTDE
jgi:TonB family protein